MSLEVGMNDGELRGGPAESRWRFVPRGRWAAVWGLLAGALLVLQMVIVLIAGDSAGRTAFGVVLGLVGCALLISSAVGLRMLNRRERR
ncbi:hypothetical protein PV342_34160 [Streptomyces sp. PA03-3a]|nr:hypothetical protein [Streptomyces sp. PA03-3a]